MTKQLDTIWQLVLHSDCYGTGTAAVHSSVSQTPKQETADHKLLTLQPEDRAMPTFCKFLEYAQRPLC